MTVVQVPVGGVSAIVLDAAELGGGCAVGVVGLAHPAAASTNGSPTDNMALGIKPTHRSPVIPRCSNSRVPTGFTDPPDQFCVLTMRTHTARGDDVVYTVNEIVT